MESALLVCKRFSKIIMAVGYLVTQAVGTKVQRSLAITLPLGQPLHHLIAMEIITTTPRSTSAKIQEYKFMINGKDVNLVKEL